VFETLHGRIKWKQTVRGVFITIPARRGAMTHLYGPLVGFWLIAAGVHYRHLLESPHVQDSEFTLQLIAAGIYVFGLLFSVGWLLWIFTNETSVLINAREMKVQRMVMSIEVATRTFETPEMRGLKFIPPIPTWGSLGHPDPRTSKVQFQVGDQTHTLAVGLSENEALALFAAMHRVYKFPDYSYSHVEFARVEL
jgi:hypothetical protein